MRHAKLKDLPDIVRIYNSTIDSRIATADVEPVTVDSKKSWFNAHSEARPIYVEEIDGRVVGWVSYEDFYGRAAYHRTAEVSIYVDDECRGQGLGKKLLDQSINICPSLGLQKLVAFIFAHNTISLGLFKSYGFEVWGELPDVAEMDGNEYSLSILGLDISQSFKSG